MAATAIAALAGPAVAVAVAVAHSAIQHSVAQHSVAQHSVAQHSALQPGEGPLALSVTFASHGYAQTGSTITIKGMVSNLTGSAMNDLSVGMWSSPTPLGSMANVTNFAAGTYTPTNVQAVTGVKPFVVTSLAAHTAKPWTVQVPAKALGLSCFGVYPLIAQVSDGSGAQFASSDIPLPFWPRRPRGCQANPRRVGVSWIWPLIDSPHQGPCQGVLADNALATSIRPYGRLHDLLTAASHYPGASLTFAVDPALLDSLTLMSQPYQVGQVGRSASCGHTTQYPASQDAAAWLRNLRRVSAGHVLFVTPYADVDIAALIRNGNADLDMDLNLAASDGEQIAHEVLSRDPRPVSLPAAGPKLAAVAWPAGGIASGTVLEYLAAELKIKTVILASPIASGPYPPAVTEKTTQAGQQVNVLLADDSLSALLRSRAVESRQPATIFGVSQLFLAETAMNVTANPSVPRPIVVTPPRRWSPSLSLANDLLADTTAPWLRPEDIGQLSKLPPQPVAGVLQSRPGAELSGRLLAKVNALDGKVGLLESIFASPDPALRHAVFGIESSRWRSRGGLGRARSALARTSQYVSGQFGRLSLGGNRYVTLGGTSGSVIVSVRNGLSYPIKVRLRVKMTELNGNVSIAVPPQAIQSTQWGAVLKEIIQVAPGKVAEKKLAVHATQTGRALLHFSLLSPDGVVLPHGRLTMQVQASDFGRIALIICAAALAIYVLASAARAIRHGRPAPPGAGGAATSPPDLPEGGGEPAVLAWGGDPPEPPDSVIVDQPELTPAGHVAADPLVGSPGHGPVEDGQ